MKLEEHLKKYPHIRLATPEDDAKIIAFLKSIPMRMTDIHFRYQFNESIESFLRPQGNKAYVFILESSDGSIQGYSVISIRDYYIKGQHQTAAYLSDLRISKNIEENVRQEWKDCIGNTLFDYPNIDEFKDIPYYYSAILDKNIRALQVFSHQDFPAVFHPLLKYQAISILGRNPLSYLLNIKNFFPLNKTSKKFHIRLATQKDEEALRTFLHLQNKKKLWGDFFCHPHENVPDEWERRKKSWPDFSIRNFILITDEHQKIVFCTLPWSPRKARQLVVEKAPQVYILLGKIFKLMGKMPIRIGHPLELLYLTHFELAHHLNDSQRHHLLTIFFNYFYKSKLPKLYHSVTFCDFYDESVKKTLQNFICFNTKATIYQTYAKKAHPEILTTNDYPIKQFSFEAAIV